MPSPRGRTLAQGPELGAQTRMGRHWGQIRTGTRSGPCCPRPGSALWHRVQGDAGSEEQPSSPVCVALVHLCSTGCGDREPRHRHSLFFPTLLIKPTRNRSVCFHPQAIESAQQIEDFYCMKISFSFVHTDSLCPFHL